MREPWQAGRLTSFHFFSKVSRLIDGKGYKQGVFGCSLS